MGDDKEHDATAALIGTPVTVRRRHQGKSREEYLEERAGRATATVLEVAGIYGRRRRQYIALAVAVAIAAGIVLWLMIL